MSYLLAFVLLVLVLVGRSYIVRHIFTAKRRANIHHPHGPYENIEINTAQGTIYGWLINSKDAKGYFLLVHGWGSNKSAMLRYIEPLLENGYDVLAIDVLGHGESESNERQISIKSFVESIKATLDYVEKSSDIYHEKIYVLGHSLGGIAASIVNATDDRIHALITDSMPTSLKSISESMANHIKIPYIPFGWLFVNWFLLRGGVLLKARREWNLSKIINSQQAPAMAVHSTQDKKVPIDNVDVLLNASNFKEVIKVETHGHDNCVKDECFWENVFDFMAKYEKYNI